MSLSNDFPDYVRSLCGEGPYPFQRNMIARLLDPMKHPSDSIRLHLPWGEVRNFLVPAANAACPVFETKARAAASSAIRDAVAHGVGVIGIDYGRDEISVTPVKYEDFCAVSVRDDE